jgi:hypothetical protein
MQQHVKMICKSAIAITLFSSVVITSHAAEKNAVIAPMFDQMIKRQHSTNLNPNKAVTPSMVVSTKRRIVGPSMAVSTPRRVTNLRQNSMGTRTIVAPMFTPVMTRQRAVK